MDVNSKVNSKKSGGISTFPSQRFTVATTLKLFYVYVLITNMIVISRETEPSHRTLLLHGPRVVCDIFIRIYVLKKENRNLIYY